jgi:hypothetical protein
MDETASRVTLISDVMSSAIVSENLVAAEVRPPGLLSTKAGILHCDENTTALRQQFEM